MAPARRRGAAAAAAENRPTEAEQRRQRPQRRGRREEVEVEETEAAENETEEAAAAEDEDNDKNSTQRLVRLQFDEPLSWRPGRPIATGELIRRLEALSHELSELDQETFEAESLSQVAQELANHQLLQHKDKGVKAFVAACLVDILCLCAPNAPFTQTQLQDIFALFIQTILPALQDPTSTYDAQHKYVLHSLSEVRSIVLVNDLDNSEALQLQLFATLFDAVSATKNVAGGRLPTDVEHDISDILVCLIEEGANVPPKVVDVIMAQFLRAAAPGALRGGSGGGGGSKEELDRYQSTLLLKEEPPAYQIAKLICLACADKMTRSVAQYFSDVIIDFSKADGGRAGAEAAGRNGHRAGGAHDEADGSDDETHDGPSDADLREMRKAHLLLRELWRAAPQVLSNVVPQLEAELSADNVHLRRLATETLGDMIAGIGAAGPPPPPVLDPAAYPLLRLDSSSSSSGGSGSGSILTTPSSPHSFAQSHPHVYQSFVLRRNDRSGLIRAAWATAAGYILATSAGGIGLSREEEAVLVPGLGDKLNDSDEKVRLAAVEAIRCFALRDVIGKLAAQGGVARPGSVLGNLADRCRDRKAHVRVEAMALLGRLWAAATGELLAGDEAVTAALGAVPSRIFNAIYANDVELNLLVDRVTYEYLLPLSYPAWKKSGAGAGAEKGARKAKASAAPPDVDADALRAQRLLLLLRSLDAGAKKAFWALQSRQPQFSSILAGFLKQCEAWNGGVGGGGGGGDAGSRKAAAAAIDKSCQYLAQFFPDAAKAKADLQRFAKLNDRRSYQLVRFVIGPEYDYTTMYRALKELVKKLQAGSGNAAGLLDTLVPLLYRSGCILFNRSHLTTVMEYSKGGGGTETGPAAADPDNMAAVANELLKEVSQRNPGLFRTTMGALCQELVAQAPSATRANDPVVMDSLKACASYARKYPQELPRERALLDAWIRFALYGRPEKAAKYAVRILLATATGGHDRAEADSAAQELAQTATADWRFGAPRFLNRLVAVGELARRAPAVLAGQQPDELRQVVMDILRRPDDEVAAPAGSDEAWLDDSELDEEARAKVLGLRFLVQQLLGVEEGEAGRRQATQLVAFLVQMVAEGGTPAGGGTGGGRLRARLRLAAALALLKICTHRQGVYAYDDLLGPAEFNALALVVQDAQPAVRRAFVAKLQTYLVQGRLRPRFYTMIFLAAFEPAVDFRAQIETWIRSRARYFAERRQPVLEGVMARLISLLAHHPDYPEGDEGSAAVEELLDHARYLVFYLANVASEANVGLIARYAERVKQTRDALTPARSQRLYVLSDLAQAAVRRCLHRRGWVAEPYAAKVGVPQGLYAPLPSHEAAQQIAQTQYIPDGVEERLDELFRSKKRKSTEDAPHNAKRSRGGPAGSGAQSRLPSHPKAAKKAAKNSGHGSHSNGSSHKKASSPARRRRSSPAIPDSERRRSGRATVRKTQTSYMERDSDEDDEEMLEGVAEWEYLEGEREGKKHEEGEDESEEEEEREEEEEAEEEEGRRRGKKATATDSDGGGGGQSKKNDGSGGRSNKNDGSGGQSKNDDGQDAEDDGNDGDKEDGEAKDDEEEEHRTRARPEKTRTSRATRTRRGAS